MNLQQSRVLKCLIFVIFFLRISAVQIVEKLTLDFINQQIGHVNVCNFVVCSKSEHFKIIKRISSAHTCLIDVRRFTNPKYFRQYFHDENRYLFIVENGCALSRRYLQQANSLGLLGSKYIWLLIQSLETKQTININSPSNHIGITSNFKDFELTIRSEVYLAQKTPQKNIRILGMYKRDPDNTLITEYLNDWNLNKGFNNRILKCYAIRRQDLQGRIFNAAIVLSDPKSLTHSEDLVDLHIDSLSKLDYAVVSLVTSSLNASTNFIATTSWGNKVNGRFDGMIGLVEKGKAEIAVTQSFPTEERLKVVEYIDKPIRTGTGYIFLSPPLSFNRNIFILPFDGYVWFTFVGLVLLTMPLLYYASKVESKERYKSNRISDYDRLKRRFKSYSWGDIAMLNIASICVQGASQTMNPSGLASRIIIITLYVTLIFVSVSYNAYIMVLLGSTDKSIVSLADLYQSNLELGVHNVAYNKWYYSSAEEPLRKAMAKKIFLNKKRDPFVSVEEGVRRIRADRYAFDAEHSPVYHMVKTIFTEEEKCRLQSIKQPFVPDIEPMLSIKKDLTYTEILKIKFERLHERGLAHRIGVRLYTKKPRCTSSRSFHFNISLMDTHHIFRLLTYAILTSWILLIFEVFAFKKKLKQIYKRAERFIRKAGLRQKWFRER